MKHLYEYRSLIGDIAIISDGETVCDIIPKNSPDYDKRVPKEYIAEPNDVILKMKKWLDLYFIGIEPDFEPPYKYKAQTIGGNTK